MADVKISALPTGSALSGTEIIPIVQGGDTVKTTTGQIKELVVGSGENMLVDKEYVDAKDAQLGADLNKKMEVPMNGNLDAGPIRYANNNPSTLDGKLKRIVINILNYSSDVYIYIFDSTWVLRNKNVLSVSVGVNDIDLSFQNIDIYKGDYIAIYSTTSTIGYYSSGGPGMFFLDSAELSGLSIGERITTPSYAASLYVNFYYEIGNVIDMLEKKVSLIDYNNEIGNVDVSMTWTDNSFITADGTIGTFNGLSLSSNIPTKCGIYRYIGAMYLAGTVAFFDDNDICIGGFTNPNPTGYTYEAEIETPLNISYVRVTCSTEKIGSFSFSTTIDKRLDAISNNIQQYGTIIKTVASTGADFTTIADAIAWASNNANEYNHVDIYIKNGTYNELMLDINVDYINLIGESRDETIIYSDGSTIAGEAVDKQGIMSTAICYHKNLTFKAKNVRYPIHNDGRSKVFDCSFENCHFIFEIDTNMSGPVGIGSYANQHHTFNNCIFEVIGLVTSESLAEWGIFWHNQSTQSAKCFLTLNNPIFINCGIAYIYDEGSGQSDTVNIINPQTNLMHKGIKLDATNTSTPYNIKIDIIGNINAIESTANRDVNMYHFDGYSKKAKNISGLTIPKGFPVDAFAAFIILSYNKLNVTRCGSPLNLYGVAESDIELNGDGYIINKNKIAKCYTSANNYSKGDFLTISSSTNYFEKTMTRDNACAIVVENITLASDGLVNAFLLP